VNEEYFPSREDILKSVETVLSSSAIKDIVLSVYLLGSAAKGQMRKDSDIDLALLPFPGMKINDKQRLQLSSELSFLLRWVIDMGVISSADLVYARESLLNGICLYRNNIDLNTIEKNRLISMYYQFNEDRQEVIIAYSAR